jgi:hypothetical protein
MTSKYANQIYSFRFQPYFVIEMVKAGYMRKRRWKEIRGGQRRYFFGHRNEEVGMIEDYGSDILDLEFNPNIGEVTSFTTGSGGKEDERREIKGARDKGMVKNSRLHELEMQYLRSSKKRMRRI